MFSKGSIMLPFFYFQKGKYMTRYGTTRLEAFNKLQKRKELKWAESYADLKDQIDQAILRGEAYVNTCLCDFDLMTFEETYKVTSQSRWTYEQLKNENYALVICIVGEPLYKNSNEHFSDTFLHIRWGDKRPFLYNLQNRFLTKKPWLKDISKEFRKSDAKKDKSIQELIKEKEPAKTDSPSQYRLINNQFSCKASLRNKLAIKSKYRLINNQICCKPNFRNILRIKSKHKLIRKHLVPKRKKRERLKVRVIFRLIPKSLAFKTKNRTKLKLRTNLKLTANNAVGVKTKTLANDPPKREIVLKKENITSIEDLNKFINK